MKILHKNGLEIVDINRRKAIRYRCLNCSGYSTAEVRDCNFHDCHLYEFRSGKDKQDPQKRSKAIRMYCLEWCMLGQSFEVKLCPCIDCSLHPYRHTEIDTTHLILEEAA